MGGMSEYIDSEAVKGLFADTAASGTTDERAELGEIYDGLSERGRKALITTAKALEARERRRKAQ